MKAYFFIQSGNYPFLFLNDFHNVLQEFGLESASFWCYDVYWGIWMSMRSSSHVELKPHEVVLLAHTDLQVKEAPPQAIAYEPPMAQILFSVRNFTFCV